VRKDLRFKSLKHLYPSINKIFPGKPVRTKHGEGFVLGAVDPSEVEDDEVDKLFYVKIGEKVFEVDKNEFLPDADSNEIKNPEKMLSEVLSKAKLNMENTHTENPDEEKSFGSKLLSAVLFCSSKSNPHKNINNA
jgi:hypothetical protein